MTKLAHVEHERALGMLKANVTPLVVAKDFGAILGRLEILRIVSNELGQRHTFHVQDVDLSQPDVKIQTSHLCNQFHLESVTARTSQVTHNPKIRDQTLRNRFKRFV